MFCLFTIGQKRKGGTNKKKESDKDRPRKCQRRKLYPNIRGRRQK